MIQNFGEYDKSRVTIVRDICATAKGYEAMTARKIQRKGRCFSGKSGNSCPGWSERICPDGYSEESDGNSSNWKTN